jgi:hypothetical protein
MNVYRSMSGKKDIPSQNINARLDALSDRHRIDTATSTLFRKVAYNCNGN